VEHLYFKTAAVYDSMRRMAAAAAAADAAKAATATEEGEGEAGDMDGEGGADDAEVQLKVSGATTCRRLHNT
jgi:hypothetical protein